MKIISGINSGLVLWLLLISCNAAPGPETVTVTIDQMKYSPQTVTVHKGDTILFVNEDIVAHDVTEANGAWASPRLENGDSWKYVAEADEDYYCSIHLVMKGKIKVE